VSRPPEGYEIALNGGVEEKHSSPHETIVNRPRVVLLGDPDYSQRRKCRRRLRLAKSGNVATLLKFDVEA
jgi:hypothetical protein